MSPKEKILGRRSRFMAAALASAGLSACSEPANPGATAVDSGAIDSASDSASDTGTPVPCLTAPADTGAPDTGPTVCLSAPLDTGVAGDASDTGPTPCLDVALDAGDAGADG